MLRAATRREALPARRTPPNEHSRGHRYEDFCARSATVATGAALVIAGLGPVLAAEAAAPTTRPSTGA